MRSAARRHASTAASRSPASPARSNRLSRETPRFDRIPARSGSPGGVRSAARRARLDRGVDIAGVPGPLEPDAQGVAQVRQEYGEDGVAGRGAGHRVPEGCHRDVEGLGTSGSLVLAKGPGPPKLPEKAFNVAPEAQLSFLVLASAASRVCVVKPDCARAARRSGLALTSLVESPSQPFQAVAL